MNISKSCHLHKIEIKSNAKIKSWWKNMIIIHVIAKKKNSWLVIKGVGDVFTSNCGHLKHSLGLEMLRFVKKCFWKLLKNCKNTANLFSILWQSFKNIATSLVPLKLKLHLMLVIQFDEPKTDYSFQHLSCLHFHLLIKWIFHVINPSQQQTTQSMIYGNLFCLHCHCFSKLSN